MEMQKLRRRRPIMAPVDRVRTRKVLVGQPVDVNHTPVLCSLWKGWGSKPMTSSPNGKTRRGGVEGSDTQLSHHTPSPSLRPLTDSERINSLDPVLPVPHCGNSRI